MKAAFTARVNPSYDDLPEERCHFPQTCLRQVEAALQDWIVYYEPRRTTRDGGGAGGRQAYFATARIDRIEKDIRLDGHFYAFVSDCLDFDRAVPFEEGERYFEGQLRKADGATNKGAFGRAVRPISDAEYDAIVQAGFAHALGHADRPRLQPDVPELALKPVLGSSGAPQTPFDPGTVDRPILQNMTTRLFRDRAFAAAVKSAYGDRCVVTGLKIINGGGRSEVQAAHIRPVADRGPDGVRNGLALSGTVHWMFDRGPLSVDDEYGLLIANGRLPDAAMRMLPPERRLLIPSSPSFRPAPPFSALSSRECL